MPVAPPLQRFVDDELSRSPALVSRVLAGTLQLLRDAKDGSSNPNERGHCLELIAALQKQAELYQSTFLESLHALVQQALGGPQTESGTERAKPFGGLELMDETVVDADIEISRAMQLIDTTAEWELRELQTFTSTLIGLEHVSAESNPFRPLTYATALWDAACAVATAQVQRGTLLRLSSGVAAGLLKSAWAAACSRLEEQGVQPGSYRTVVWSGAGGVRPPSIDVTRPGALSGLLSSMPGGGPGEGRVATSAAESRPARRGVVMPPEFEEALLRLEDFLKRLPHEPMAGEPPAIDPAAHLDHHRPALLASAGDPGDRQVVELVSRIFETMLSDPRLPPAFRAIVARLQVSALRLALNDATMLDSDNHPVWHLIDRLGEVGNAYSQPDDPRLVALQAFCHAAAEEVARTPAPDAALYRRALNRIDAFLAEQFQAQRRAAQPTVTALEIAERRGLLEQHFSQRLTDQMVPVRTTPGVRRFITGTWSKVLAEAVLRFGEEAEPTETYVRTVDDLLWSLQIPDHPQSRQRLIALLPVLLQRLRAGMELVALPRPEQQAMLDELMIIHAEALRPGGRTTTAALTPEQIVQRLRDEEVSGAPERKPFSDSVIDLSSMETVPADVLGSGGDPAPDDGSRIENLRAGERLRLFVLGRWSRVQLLWRSDRGLFFLFTGDSAARTHSITRRALERLAAAGLMLPLEHKPLLQRAVDHLMREIAPRP